MWKWLLTKFGYGPKANSLPEALSEDVRILYFGRANPASRWYWEYFRLPETLATEKRVSDYVTELRIREDLINTSLADEILNSLREYVVPPITWVDRV